jgi:hypothetical protein
MPKKELIRHPGEDSHPAGAGAGAVALGCEFQTAS